MSGRRPEEFGATERVCRAVVRVAAPIVPADRRAAWIEEWDAEVWHHLRNVRGAGRASGPGFLSGLALVVRCLGALPHALWIRSAGWRWSAPGGWRTVTLAARTLARDPAFTGSAVLVFGLAVAAAATLFSSYEAVVLRALPYAEPDRLVSVWAEHDERGWYQEYVAPANLFDWREQVAAFEDVAAYGDFSEEQILVTDGDAEVVEAAPVSGNLFDVLGAPAALGRTFRMEETWSDADPVVVLSHGFWEQRFGSDPGVVGRPIEMSGVLYEIVGVMPADFRYLAPDKDAWIPFRWDRALMADTFFRRAHLVRAVARLADGVTAAEATEQLRAVAARLAEAYPATNDGLTAGTTPIQEYVVGDRSRTLRLLVAAVGLLLLAACINVGYLVLVRWKGRARDVAVRRALGAGAGALARDAAVESVLLSLAGAGLGLLGSLVGMRLLAVLAPPELLASADLRPSGSLLLGAAGVMGMAALVFTVLPLRTGLLGTEPGAPASGSRRPAAAGYASRAAVSARRSPGIHGFVVLQVALSTVLIFSAVLLARSFVNLRGVEPGFGASGVLTFAVPFPDPGDDAAPNRMATARRLLDDVRDVAGVVSTGAVRQLPINGGAWTSLFAVEGGTTVQEGFEIVHREADAGYFETMQVRLVRGRLYDDDESDGLLVNETFAARVFGGADPLGRRIAFTDRPSDDSRWWRIVGVVGDERQEGLRSEARPEVFTHYAFNVPAIFRFVVRTSGDPTALVARMRDALRAIDPGLPMDEVAPLESVVSASLAEERFVTLIAGSFALLAGLLAVVGVYGVTAQATAAWQREFAVRLAVGARPRSLFTTVIWRGVVVVGAGLLVGGIAALWSARFIEALLYETASSDPATLILSAVLVGGSGLLAALPSAVRAMRTDPARSLAA